METKKRKKIIIGCALTVLLLAILTSGWLVYANQYHLWPFTGQTATAPHSNSINYSPPSKQDIDESQDAKKRASQSNDTPSSSTSDAKRTVTVGISYADVINNKLEIRAFVDGVIEGTGTCTATISNGSQTFHLTSKAFVDASSSICEPMYEDSSKLASGKWEVNVTYSSSDAQGTSDKVTVNI